MYESNGQILGTATAGVVLPATASAITGINYLYFLAAFALVLLSYNVVIALFRKLRK